MRRECGSQRFILPRDVFADPLRIPRVSSGFFLSIAPVCHASGAPKEILGAGEVYNQIAVLVDPSWLIGDNGGVTFMGSSDVKYTGIVRFILFEIFWGDGWKTRLLDLKATDLL